MGVQAVVLPGTSVGKAATLATLSRAPMHSSLQPGLVYMGSPARPFMKAGPGSTDGEVPQTGALKAFAALLPGLQLLAGWAVAVAALLPAALIARLLVASHPSSLHTLAAAAFVTAVAASGLMLVGAAAKKLMLGQLAPAAGIAKYSGQNLMRMLFWTLDAKLDDLFGRAVRGSAWWNKALQSRGVTIQGKAYIDTLWSGDYELVSYGDGAIVDRNATMFAHLGMYKAGGLTMMQETVAVGDGAVVGARAAVLPGFELEASKLLAPGQLGMQMKL